MKTADQIASELIPHIAANNAAVGQTNHRIVRLGDGYGNVRPATLLTPRDVLYHGDQGINDQGVAILSPKCPIPLQAIVGYYDTEVYLANEPGISSPMIVDLADVGGFGTGGPTPQEALINAGSAPSQDRLLIFRIRPADSGGMAVFVDVGIYAVAYEVGDGTLGYYTSSNISLPDSTDPVVYHPTAAALTSGQHRIIGIALDPTTGQLIAIPGTATTALDTLPSRSEFAESDYQAISFIGYYPCGFLYNYYGQTSPVEDDCLRIYDPRLIANKMGSGGGSSISEGAYGSRPAAGTAGRLYLATDGFVESFDTGSAWDTYGPISKLVPPDDSSFSWVNQGGASVTVSGSGIYLSVPAVGGQNARIRMKSAPTRPYSIVALFNPNYLNVNYHSFGLGWRESGSGKLVLYYFQGGSNTLESAKYDSPTAYNSGYFGVGAIMPTNNVWLKISEDSSNRYQYLSQDGVNWIQVHSVGRTDFLTADEVLWFGQTQNSSYQMGVTLLSWAVL